MTNRRSGFSLVELLATIGVIMVLIGMLLSGLSILRKHQAKAATRQLLDQLVIAIDAYRNDPGSFILDASFSTTTVGNYLWVRPQAAGKAPFLELTADQRSGLQILDSFGDPIQITTAVGASGKTFTSRITLRSLMGTSSVSTDDALLEWNVADSTTGAWMAGWRTVQ